MLGQNRAAADRLRCMQGVAHFACFCCELRPKHFLLEADEKKCVRIGRAPVVEYAGSDWAPDVAATCHVMMPVARLRLLCSCAANRLEATARGIRITEHRIVPREKRD